MLKQFEDKMQKSLDSMTNDFMTIRAGRANPHVLDKVKVDYYGVATPVAQVGNVSVPEARTIMGSFDIFHAIFTKQRCFLDGTADVPDDCHQDHESCCRKHYFSDSSSLILIHV